jgi:toluene monooxygenase system ferredoxin subunit
MAFVRCAVLDELWDGEMAPCVIEQRRVLLIRLDGTVFAYEDKCAHLGVALSEGDLRDGVLTCAAHHYQYDARSGQGINPRTVRLRRFPVRLEDGQISVDTTEEETR